MEKTDAQAETPRLRLEQWTQRLGEVLSAPLPIGRIEPVESMDKVADGPLVLLVRDRWDRPQAVALCASAKSPDLVAQGMERAAAAQACLGPELGRVILEPLKQGWLDGLSYAILPYCQPLSQQRIWRSLQRRRLAPVLLRWLSAATRQTAAIVQPDQIEPAFIEPLTHLANLTTMPDAVRADAQQALQRIDRGQWQPRHVLMHGDMHLDNILIAPREREGARRDSRAWRDRFVIIDWPGSHVRGYALYDLVRMAGALRLSGRSYAAQVALHCRLLECEPIDALGHLLAAMGHLGLNLDHFPPHDHAWLTASCHRELRDALRGCGIHSQ